MTLKKWSLDIPERSTPIIMLDANAHVCVHRRDATGSADGEKLNENGALMLDWLQGARLHAVNTLEELGPTFYGPGGNTRIDYIVTSKGKWSEVQALPDLEVHPWLKRSQGKNPWDHAPVRAKIRYELKTGQGAGRSGWSWQAMDGALRDVEQRGTFFEQTETWWESVRTQAEEICRNGDVERGWNLVQEGVGEIANRCFKSANVPEKKYILDTTWNLIEYRQMLANANRTSNRDDHDDHKMLVTMIRKSAKKRQEAKRPKADGWDRGGRRIGRNGECLATGQNIGRNGAGTKETSLQSPWSITDHSR